MEERSSIRVVDIGMEYEEEEGGEEDKSDGVYCVCVTGATGYLAGHIIFQLLAEGHTVHGTMRNLAQESRVSHLRAQEERTRGTLRLFQADLTQNGSFDGAVRGCDAVMHVANVVMLSSDDPLNDIIEPSVNGLRTVLAAIEKEPRVTQLILTSSYAAIEVGIPSEPRGPLTESDNNSAASESWKPYSYSKVLTEQEAVDWVSQQQSQGRSMRYCSIHPPMILGPQLNPDKIQSSMEVFQVILKGQYPLLPPLWFPMIDVRDVAAAHLHCMRMPTASGRYLTCNGHHWLMDLANVAREKWPNYPIPKWTMPVWAFKFVGLFDKRLDKGLLRENTREGLHVEATKICEQLGFQYQYSIEQSTIDSCQALIDMNLIEN